MQCNPDYRGPLLCRWDYPGRSACTKRKNPAPYLYLPPGEKQPLRGDAVCLLDVSTKEKRDWIML